MTIHMRTTQLNAIVLEKIKQLLLWRENRPGAWIEAAALTLLVLVGCYLLNPDNPMYLHSVFPWPWIAGVIVVLQYGLGPALLSACILCASSLYYQAHMAIPYHEIRKYLLSDLTLLLICAMFSSSWLRRVINAEELLIYTNERLNSLSNSYYMLRLSYDYLEHNVITKPSTLRQVMEDLQTLGKQTQGQLTEPLCYQFLQVLAQYCAIHSMGIYLYQNKQLSSQAIAQIGNPGPLDLADPLIQAAMTSQQMNYVSLNKLEYIARCQYLVAVPFLNATSHCLGLLVIKDMSFWTLHNQSLTTISVLVTYFIEEITSVQDFGEFYQHYPDCPSDFSRQLAKLMLIEQRLHITSSLCAIIVPQALRIYNVLENLERQRRLPDTSWHVSTADDDIFLSLIPFSNATSVHGYFTRITELLNSKMGLGVVGQAIKMRSMQLHGASYASFMQNFMAFITEKSTNE